MLTVLPPSWPHTRSNEDRESFLLCILMYSMKLKQYLEHRVLNKYTQNE